MRVKNQSHVPRNHLCAAANHHHGQPEAISNCNIDVWLLHDSVLLCHSCRPVHHVWMAYNEGNGQAKSLGGASDVQEGRGAKNEFVWNCERQTEMTNT